MQYRISDDDAGSPLVTATGNGLLRSGSRLGKTLLSVSSADASRARPGNESLALLVEVTLLLN